MINEPAEKKMSLERASTRKSSARRFASDHILVPYLFLIPALVIYTWFTIIPVINTLRLSLYQWDGISPAVPAGLQNFVDLFTNDQVFMDSFKNAFIFVIYYAIIPIIMALFLSALMTRRRIHGLTAFRTLLFVPYTLALVVVSIAWRWLYLPDGPLNQAMNLIGLGFLTRPWLGDFTYALHAIGLVASWVMYGLPMVLFIAGIQKIPRDLYDAARVDGAGAFQEFWNITLPGLIQELTVVTSLALIYAMRNFDLVFTMTRGGPGFSTYTPALLMYLNAFQYNQVGKGAAVAVILTAMNLVLVFLVTQLIGRRART
jgi:raffinose/stachyose/melibiose transport system permease protein